MLDDSPRLDDILNVFKKPKPNNDKKENPLSDLAVRYEAQQAPTDNNVKFEFTKNTEVLL